MKVKDWEGTEGEMDPKRFRRWLVKNLEISEGRARRVVRALEYELKGREHIIAQELIIRGSRLAIQMPWSFKESIQLSFYSSSFGIPKKIPKALTMDIATGQVIQGAEAAAGLVDPVSRLLGGGWESDRPGKVKKEFGGGLVFGDDGTAPDITDVRYGKIECCTPSIGGKGLKIPIDIEVTDERGSLGNDSGVKMVEITGVDMQGATVVGLHPIDGGRWELSESESQKTEEGKVRHTFILCVPCGLVIDGKTIRLIVRVIDNDDNQQVMYLVVSVSHQVKNCCG